MDEKHQEFIEQLFPKISMALTETGKISPTYIMILKDNSVVPIVLASDSDKINMKEYASIAISAAQDMDAAALILICEQTMVSKKKDDPELQAILNGLIKPSDHPDKKDYLTCVYMSNNGDCSSMISEIHSDPIGTRYTIESKWIDYATTNLVSPWKA